MRPRPVSRRLAPVLAGLAWLASVASSSAAYVVFQDGRSLKVRSYRFEGTETAVDLASGGSMRFSAAVVRFVAPDEDVESRPPPLAAAHVSQAGRSWTSYADPAFVQTILNSSTRHALDPALVAAVIKVESDFKPRAVSPKGAKGLMQLMPLTAKEQGLSDPFDAEANIEAGTAYLKRLVVRYEGDLTRALAAYNAGPRAVDAAKGIPAYRETQSYVAKVLAIAGRATAGLVD